ncbi:MAG: SCO family protein [Actinomycetota bacterium]|nr:SCO family protein [Actinomycetota bacterium]
MRSVVLMAALFVFAGGASAAGGVYLATRQPGESISQLMGLSSVPNRPAPGFSLHDQFGKTVSLASFRGKAVALYFMDPRCIDVCPLVAHEFIEADRQLGPLARHVALVGVDVNPNVRSRASLLSFDREQGLNRLHNWYYVTGSLAALQRVWAAYSITVQVRPSTLNVVHTAVIDFIAPNGRERAMAAPGCRYRKNGTGYLPGDELAQWATGIASELRRLA